MNLNVKMTFVAVATYLVQVATFWGILEGSLTFFADDDLKAVARKYWALLYMIPLVTTFVYLNYFRRTAEPSVSGGGLGGSAEVIGEGEARGGKGGNSGSFGPGGKGGDARVVGRGKATGGGGGNG